MWSYDVPRKKMLPVIAKTVSLSLSASSPCSLLQSINPENRFFYIYIYRTMWLCNSLRLTGVPTTIRQVTQGGSSPSWVCETPILLQSSTKWCNMHVYTISYTFHWDGVAKVETFWLYNEIKLLCLSDRLSIIRAHKVRCWFQIYFFFWLSREPDLSYSRFLL